MCGIFGWSVGQESKMGRGQRTRLADVLIEENTGRGYHAWGAFRTSGKAYVGETLRGLGRMDAERGLSEKLAASLLAYGHTRWATNGAVTLENCHPFTIGPITGAHNGMIYNHANLAARYGRECPVDSQHLLYHLAEGRPLTDCEGYGTLEWTDARAQPNEVFLCKMESGQLSIYGVGNRKAPTAIIWSSDERHLVEALRYAGLAGFEYEIQTGRVYSAIDGVLFKTAARLDLGNGTRRPSARDLAKTSGMVSTPVTVADAFARLGAPSGVVASFAVPFFDAPVSKAAEPSPQALAAARKRAALQARLSAPQALRLVPKPDPCAATPTVRDLWPTRGKLQGIVDRPDLSTLSIGHDGRVYDKRGRFVAIELTDEEREEIATQQDMDEAYEALRSFTNGEE